MIKIHLTLSQFHLKQGEKCGGYVKNVVIAGKQVFKVEQKMALDVQNVVKKRREKRQKKINLSAMAH